MLVKETLYALGDVTIIPAIESKVRHRSECNVFYTDKVTGKQYLPIFTAPMDMVVGKENYEIWEENKIIPILPRTEVVADRINYALNTRWAAFGLDEFEELFCDKMRANEYCNKNLRVLIDIANGHIKSLQTSITKAKTLAQEFHYNIEIMAGNIANPDTYLKLAKAGCDYVRCSIGSGGVCITSSNTSTHMPMASLLNGCWLLKHEYHLDCKIIADGGINSYANAIKALALGADYVMMGSVLAKCFESMGEFISAERTSKEFTYDPLSELNEMRFRFGDESEKKKIIREFTLLTKPFYGMSTRKAQIKIQLALGKTKDEIKTKTSEGIEKVITVEYTVNQWTNNFIDYLRSSMSYCNFTEISEYVGGPKLCLLSESAKNAINK